MDEVSERKRIERERAESGAAPAPDLRAAAGESEDGAHAESGRCEVLFPPCDTGGLVRFKLEGRGRGKGIVSLAQFRSVLNPQLRPVAVKHHRSPSQCDTCEGK